MTCYPLVFWVIAAIFAAPHVDAKTAMKYAWAMVAVGIVFWGIEIAIS